jgi:N-acetylated-alpha-linked acidic dipeptidase
LIVSINRIIIQDRYVLIGNHRDAWVLGAIDPTSGTASMLEISRALSELKINKGWKPKRSLIFCSWGAEEYGLIGLIYHQNIKL